MHVAYQYVVSLYNYVLLCYECFECHTLSAFLQIIQFDSLMVCRFHEKMPIKLTLHWPFSNMFTSLSWFSGNSGRAKDNFLDHSI